jgi:hypothetical protein
MFELAQIEKPRLEQALGKLGEKAKSLGIPYQPKVYDTENKFTFNLLKLAYLIGRGEVILRGRNEICLLTAERVDQRLLKQVSGVDDMLKVVKLWELVDLSSVLVPAYFFRPHRSWSGGRCGELFNKVPVEGEEHLVLEIAGEPVCFAVRKKGGVVLFDLVSLSMEWLQEGETILGKFLRRYRVAPTAIVPVPPEYFIAATFAVLGNPFRKWRLN